MTDSFNQVISLKMLLEPAPVQLVCFIKLDMAGEQLSIINAFITNMLNVLLRFLHYTCWLSWLLRENSSVTVINESACLLANPSCFRAVKAEPATTCELLASQLGKLYPLLMGC